MTTFSQMVDEAVRESKRPDMLSEIATYLNQTVREVHMRPDVNAPLTYRENFKESQVVADQPSGQVWDIPNPAVFQRVAGIRYTTLMSRYGGHVWATEKVPGPGVEPDEYFFYRVGSSLVFSNYGGTGGVIDIGWFEFPNRLKYLSAAQRPATYDDLDGWTYAAGVVTDSQKSWAREVTSNWLLLRWHDVLLEGVRAKIYKRVSDTERQRTSYSLYQQQRQGLWISETVELGG
jgi:hypothetical protein